MTRDPGTIQSLRPLGGGDERAHTGRRNRIAESRVDDRPFELHPRGVGEILDAAFEVLGDRFGMIVGLCTLVWLPVRALQPFLGPRTWLESGAMPSAGFFASTLATFGLQAMVQIFSIALVAVIVAASLQQRRVSVGSALGRTLRRLFGVLLLSIISLLTTWAGTLMCFVGAIYFYFKLSLTTSVYMLEDATVPESLRRSFELTRGSFGRWVAIVLVIFCFTTPLGLVAGLGDAVEARRWMVETLSISGTTFDVLDVLFSSLFMGVATAATSVAITLYYFDCRVRRDGQDLRVELARLTHLHAATLAPSASA